MVSPPNTIVHAELETATSFAPEVGGEYAVSPPDTVTPAEPEGSCMLCCPASPQSYPVQHAFGPKAPPHELRRSG